MKKRLFILVTSLVLLLGSFPTYIHLHSSTWNLQKFQAQKLTWSTCFSNLECSTLTVPMDYNHIDDQVFHLQVLRHRATASTGYLGAIVVNPGGPGGSGVDYAYDAENIVSKAIYSHFDIVGFDPRGVNSSEPLRCLTDKEEDDYIANNGRALTQKEITETVTAAKMFAATCATKAGVRLGHYSTLETAKDMEILRIALGQPKLNYLGKSYGTFLGTLYAALYPKSMGRFVLDGAIDPNASVRDSNLIQAVGFDQDLSDFLKQEKNLTLAQISTLIDFSATNQLQTPTHRIATPALVATGIASALYDPTSGWPQLSMALAQAIQEKNPTKLLELADEYDGRDTSGHYVDNQSDISQVINCLDSSDTRTLSAISADEANFAAAAPIFGPFLTYAGLTCHFWRAHPVLSPVPLHSLATPPLLVIGVTRDPATPYAWAINLHKELLNSTLLTFDGDGHTGHNRGSSCIDGVVDHYFLTGQAPKKSLVCTA